MSENCSRMIGSVSVPTFFTAMPSASVLPPTAGLAVQRIPHRGIKPHSTPTISMPGLIALRRDRDAGDQPTAADRNYQHVEVGRILQHLERNSALSCDDPGRRKDG